MRPVRERPLCPVRDRRRAAQCKRRRDRHPLLRSAIRTLHTARGEWWCGRAIPASLATRLSAEVTAVRRRPSRSSRRATWSGSAAGSIADTLHALSRGAEKYCENGMTRTYNGPSQDTRDNTYGGYRIRSSSARSRSARSPRTDRSRRSRRAVRRITTGRRSAMNAGPGKKVGIAGIGGLGHGLSSPTRLAPTPSPHTSPDKVRRRAPGRRRGRGSRDKAQMKAHSKLRSDVNPSPPRTILTPSPAC